MHGSFNTVVFDGDANLVLDCDVGCDLELQGSAESGIVTKVHEGAYPAYTGATEVTPSQDTQVLTTANTTVFQNITINPIPSNYGLITYNGSVLTVS